MKFSDEKCNFKRLHEILGYVVVEMIKVKGYKIKRISNEDLTDILESLRIKLREWMNKGISFTNNRVLVKEINKFRIMGPS